MQWFALAGFSNRQPGGTSAGVAVGLCNLCANGLVTHAAEEYVRAGLHTASSIMQERAAMRHAEQNISANTFFFSFRRKCGFLLSKMIRPSDFCVVF